MKRFLPLLLCCASPAAAVGEMYATAELGYASADFNLGSPYNGMVDDREMTIGAEVGFSFGERMAVELGVNKYNSFDGRATPCAPGAVCTNAVIETGGNDVMMYSIALMPHVHVADVELFAELGYYNAKIDTDIGMADDDFTEDGVLFGVGARWYFREPWSVSVEAVRFDDNIYQLAFGVGWGLRSDHERDPDDDLEESERVGLLRRERD